jgi:transposase
LCLTRNRLTINKASKVKTNKKYKGEEIIGVDKNYANVIASSNEEVYGDGVNDLLTKKSDILSKKNKQRQSFWSVKKKYKEELLDKNISPKRKEKLEQKILNIKKYNLGYKKYDRLKNKYDQHAKSLINNSLNKFINEELPYEVVTEKLNFNGKSKYKKRVKRLMSSWIKGYVRERIEYKTALNKIKVTEVNAAYTSQVCGECGAFGHSIGDTFHCPNCGRVVLVHINAAQVILKRRDDTEINLLTPPDRVKQILLGRINTVVGSQGDGSVKKNKNRK